jgi:hypothetical protein
MLILIFGVLLPNYLLFIFILMWPCIYFHWKINNYKCILTELEYYLDDKPFPKVNDKEYPFIKKELLNFGINLSHIQIHYIVIYGFTILWIIGFIRYIIYKKNDENIFL